MEYTLPLVFFHLQPSSFGESVPTVASDSCSWLFQLPPEVLALTGFFIGVGFFATFYPRSDARHEH